MAWLKTMLTILINQSSENVTKDSTLKVDSQSCRSSESGSELFHFCFGQPNTCPVPDIDQKLTMIYTPPPNCEEKREKAIATHDLFKGTCATPDCIQAASRILQSLNSKVDPCDDFYEFACGSYVKTTKIPVDRRKVNLWDTARDETFKKIKNLLGTKVKKDEKRVLAYPKILFQSCINVNKYAYAEKILLNILDEKGGWPVLKKSWKETNYTWDEYIYYYRDKGYLPNYLIKFTFKTMASQYVQLGPATFGIGQNYLTDTKKQVNDNEYFKYMVRVATTFGATEEKAKSELLESFNLEVALAKASKLGGSPGIYTVSTLEKYYPSIPWLEYINNIISPDYRYYETSEVFIENLQYVKTLQDILKSTSKRVLANYLMWRVVENSLNYLPAKFKTLRDEFYESIGYWSILTQPREDFCAYAVSDRMPIAVRALFLNSDLGMLKTDKIQISNLAQDMKNILYNRASSYTWMSKSTQERMKELLNKLEVHVSNPIDLLVKPAAFEKYYGQVDLHVNQSFFESMLAVTKFNFRYKLIKKPWESKKMIGCDLYNIFADNPKVKWISCGNSLEITAPAVHTFYSNLLPAFINYGNIASNIAFEMIRSIQKQPWWDVADKVAFQNKAVCFLQNYNNCTTKNYNFKIDPRRTLDTNVLDLSAANFAFQAYERWIHRNGGDTRLIGLENYTPKQLFWISYANSRCTKYSKHEMFQVTSKKKYMPMHERVNLPLTQFWEFSRDFECRKDSKMFLDMSDTCSSIW